jgi:tRNA threonylcarbamoyladenosine biosynthesis protein TsaE
MEVNISSTEELKKLAGKLAQKAFAGDVYALYGELGSGKTTFTRYFVESLGFDSKVQSPTFVIIRKYQSSVDNLYSEKTEISKIYHVDLYRLTTKEEVKDLGLEEMFLEKDAITIIEWPEIYESNLPEDTIKIRFEYLFDNANEEERKIYVQNLH